MRLLSLSVDKFGVYDNTTFYFAKDHDDKCEKNISENEKRENTGNPVLTTVFKKTGVRDSTVIIGNNGAGKTTLARILAEIASNPRTEKFKYRLTYEKDGHLYTCSNEDTVFPVFNFIYYSPVYYSEQEIAEPLPPFGKNEAHVIDISTTYCLAHDADKEKGNVEYERMMTGSSGYSNFSQIALNRMEDYCRIVEMISDISGEFDSYSRFFHFPEVIRITPVRKTEIMARYFGLKSYHGFDMQSVNGAPHFGIREETFKQCKDAFLAFESAMEKYAGNESFLTNFALVLIIDWITDVMQAVVQHLGGIERILELIVENANIIEVNLLTFLEKMLSSVQNNNLADVFELEKRIKLYNMFSSSDYDYMDITLDVNNRERSLEIIRLYFGIRGIYDFLSFRFLPPLSSGEFLTLLLFSRLNRVLKDQRGRDVVLFLDEVDTLMHPENQKRYVYQVLSFLNERFDIDAHVIFATHSPILLSDFPSSNVICLRKNEDRTTVEEVEGDTFAANIYRLYSDDFLINDGLLGEVAENFIKKIIKEKDDCKFNSYVNLIGDNVLKTLVKVSRKEKFNAKNKSKKDR